MKSKGAIKFFTVALIIVCLYQLSFTIVTSVIENKAENYADGNVEKKERFLDSIRHEPVYNLLVKEYTYNECLQRELNLGLDLQGGMHITLEISTKDLLLELSNNNEDENFRKALNMAEQKQKNSQEDYLTLFINSFQELEPDGQIAAIFATRENKDDISYNSSNEEVLEFLRSEVSDALDRTYNILRTRVDQYGVSQPNIQKQPGPGRIIVELPGVDNPERIRSLLQETAELEFWETYETEEILSNIQKANEVIRRVEELERSDKQDDTTMASNEQDTASDDVPFFGEGEEEAEDTSAMADEGQEGIDTTDLLAGTDTAAQDTAPQNLSEEEFRQENPLFSVLTPAVRRTDQGTFPREGPVVGYARGLDTAQVNEYLNMEKVQSVLPRKLRLFWSAKPASDDRNVYQLIAAKVTTADGSPPLTGQVVTDARTDISKQGERQVSIQMNSRGARIWERLTGDNIGRSIAIVLDDRVYSFPNVNAEISGGNSVISGRFTTTEANDLANVLESGKLPLAINIVEESVIGPSLGQESITAGLWSLVAGLILVLIFMGFYYNHGGLVANVALLANMFFIMGVLASLGAALTLPGMAGIVLTIGMSVDANVLIFERIREELKEGKGIRLAVADGYRNAYSSIIDANLTTLLTAIILYTFGSGPIHGFAIILIIGILTSLFSAIFITRLIFDWALAKDKIVHYGNTLTINAFKNLNFDFIAKRKVAYMISGVIVGAGLISLIFHGLTYGIDFKGGYSYIVSFEKPVKPTNIRSTLENPFDGMPQVKTFGSDREYKITTDYKIEQTAEGTSEEVKSALTAGLNQIGPNYNVKSSQKVGPTIAEDIRTSAIWAVLFSLIVIFLYIFLRFRKWQYGLGALAAVFHDVLVILGLFSLLRSFMPFSMEIDQAFIAAILTVVGYSINDTVVVFDRMRERLSISKRNPFVDTVNRALNDTLSRTFVTSFTTILVILILFIFGGELIRGFSFALLIGILVGTYSSLFVSSPIVMDLQKDKH